MKVKLLVGRAGTGFSQNVGEVVEMSDAKAKRLIDAGQAEAVKPAPKKKPKK